jgi:hypothetical protein
MGFLDRLLDRRGQRGSGGGRGTRDDSLQYVQTQSTEQSASHHGGHAPSDQGSQGLGSQDPQAQDAQSQDPAEYDVQGGGDSGGDGGGGDSGGGADGGGGGD